MSSRTEVGQHGLGGQHLPVGRLARAVPSGSPAALYAAYPATPIEVVAGESVEVEFSFADAYRMP